MDTSQTSFFDGGKSLDALCPADDPLALFTQHVDFTGLEKVCEKIWRGEMQKNSGCGRPPWPVRVMLRVLFLKHLYNLSDEQTERQIDDRKTFRRFVGLSLMDSVPDRGTIWLYNEALCKADGGRLLFEAFNQQLAQKGLLIKEGKILDATFTLVPIQRNTRSEQETLKKGDVPEDWKSHPRKLSQKDTDARWVKKGMASFYGYKNHIACGESSKLIHEYTVTSASEHESQLVSKLLKEGDIRVHADSAYSGEPIAGFLRELSLGNLIHEKGERGHPLTEKQVEDNRKKSRIRARVEHVFATVENSMGRIFNRCIGFVRNSSVIDFRNFCYNAIRCVSLMKMKPEERAILLVPIRIVG